MESAIELLGVLVNSVLEHLPELVQLALTLIVTLANGISQSSPSLIPSIVDVVFKIVDILTNQETLTQLLEAAFTIITELAFGLMENIDQIIDATYAIIDGIVDFLLMPENLAMLVETAVKLIVAIGSGLVKAIPRLLVSVASVIGSIFTNFAQADWGQIGTDLVDGFKKGIERSWKNLKEWFTDLFGDLKDVAKRILGIKSPSREFAKIGAFTAEGFGVGFNKAFGDVEKDIESALDFNGATFGVNAYGSYSGGVLSGIGGGTSFGTVNINIDGANVQDDEELADMIAERLQIMTERRGAVFA
jgi:phage-related protein